MPSILPTTHDEILRTGILDPTFAAALKETPVPFDPSAPLTTIKGFIQGELPNAQKALEASRPASITESEHLISLRDGHQSRVIVCHRSSRLTDGNSPLIMLLFGGGYCLGFPESEVPLARLLVEAYNAVVVLPCYRLAPEHPFPCGINDVWDSLQWLASESRQPRSTILPPSTNPRAGFIIGGTSAGAALTASVAHLARDNKLDPPVTGQFLATGSFISPSHVPPKYQHLYLSRTQNADAPLLNMRLYNMFQEALKPDRTSPLWASFDQHHPEDGPGEVKMGHMGIPPTYFQICGSDPTRDDDLIYEKVLREECGVPTRVDLYEGYPHCWWSMFPKLPMTVQRYKDTVEGIGWLLLQAKQ